MTSSNPFRQIFPETELVKFCRRQDRLLFFSIVNELICDDSVILDFGAGRNRFPEFGRHLNHISTLKGRCKRVIGVDPDPVVLGNDTLDLALVIEDDNRIPLEDNSVDLIFSYAVFEHLSNVEKIARELERVLKPGGWLCAWTPNKWGYVGIGSRMIPNTMHARFLRLVQPNSRVERDVFPVQYKLNTMRDVKKYFPGTNFVNYSFYFNGQPSYNFGSSVIAVFWLFYMAVMPRTFSQSLMIFLQKKGDQSTAGVDGH